MGFREWRTMRTNKVLVFTLDGVVGRVVDEESGQDLEYVQISGV